MNTPIVDFLKKYASGNSLRFHMPGHKGVEYLGFEKYDLTEIDGADSLYEANGIILESQSNASKIFDCDTFYSTGGSSQVVKAMLYTAILLSPTNGKKPLVFAGRNAHKSFISAVGLLDVKVKWLYSKGKEGYLSCNLTPEQIDKELSKAKVKPIAVYLTSPDYLGNILDVENISKVCKKHGVLLLVDCAHGSYLKFLEKSLFPIDLGADMCCTSAHKTLPVITGGGYFHLKKGLTSKSQINPQSALSIFGSTSPSYLILASLDNANKLLFSGYSEKIKDFVKEVEKLKTELKNRGFKLVGNEPLKLTINANSVGYSGVELAKKLKDFSIISEFYDEDYLVLMLSVENQLIAIERLKNALFSIEKREKITKNPPKVVKPKRSMSVRNAMLKPCEELEVDKCLGRVLAQTNLSCPPAIAVVVSGEVIDEKAIEVLKYYKIKKCSVVCR